MKTRYLIATGLLAAFLGVIAAALTMLPENRPTNTKTNFDRVEEGMTEAQVQAIFGRPYAQAMFSGECTHSVWDSEDGAFALVTFVGDTVRVKSWHIPNETLVEKVCRLLCMP